jgi:hypothetical protein
MKKTTKTTKVKKIEPGYFLIKWGNGTISVLFALDEIDLFMKLDQEGDPLSSNSKIYILPEFFHLQTEINKENKIIVHEEDSTLKRLKWGNNIFERAYLGGDKW